MRLSYVPPTVPVPTMSLDAADHLLYFCLLALSPATLVRVCNTTTLNLQLSTLLFLNCLHKTPLFFTEGVSNGVTSLWHIVRLVPHTNLRLPFVLSYTSSPDLSNGTFYPSVYTFTRFLPFPNSLDDISQFPSPYSTP